MTTNTNRPLIHFVHGKESGPWGTKIQVLSEIAKKYNYDVESLDYSFTLDPALRVQHLIQSCQQRQPTFLVGSSMGAWVALTASANLPVKGLFLMAPAIGISGYPPYQIGCDGSVIDVVHGWRDPLIPVDNIVQFCKKHQCTLLIVDDEHRLKNRLDLVSTYFECFLKRMQSL